MERAKTKVFTVAVLLGLIMGLPLLTASVSAVPAANFKVNGKLPGIVHSPMGDMPDTLMLQTLSDCNDLCGTGSVHGIGCGATFFFDYTVVRGVDSWTMTGQILRTNMGHQGWYCQWIGCTISLTVFFSRNAMSFSINDGSDVVFVGSGTPIM